jgi:MFS family permease
VGFIVTTLGLASFLLVLLPAVPVWVAIPTFALAGLGMGLGYAPLSLIVLREASPSAQGASTSALSLLDTLGTALGTGVSGAIIAASLRASLDQGLGLGIAFCVAIAVGILGFAMTGRLRPAEASRRATTMPSPVSPG